jgi:hypothetical protein
MICSIKCGKLLETLQKSLVIAKLSPWESNTRRNAIVLYTGLCTARTSWTQWGGPDDDRHFQRNFAKLRMTAKVITPHTRPPAHFHLVTPSTRPPALHAMVLHVGHRGGASCKGEMGWGEGMGGEGGGLVTVHERTRSFEPLPFRPSHV